MPRVRILPTCSICQDDSSPEPYVFTLCGHVFHSPCIRQWDETQRAQRRVTKCPACNSTLKRVAGAQRNEGLGTRFVSLHSLSERVIERGSSPVEAVDEPRELQNVVRDQRQRLAEAKEVSTRLRTERAALQSSLDQATREMAEAQTRELATHSKHVRQLAVMARKGQEEREASSRELRQLTGQMEKVRVACVRAKEERDELQEQFNKQARELEETHESMIAFSREVDRLSESRTQIEQELKTMKATVRSLQIRSAAFEAKSEKYKNEAHALRKEVANCRSSPPSKSYTSTWGANLDQTPISHRRSGLNSIPLRSGSPQSSLLESARIASTSANTSLPTFSSMSLPKLNHRKRSVTEMESSPDPTQSSRVRTRESNHEQGTDSAQFQSAGQDPSRQLTLPSLFGAEERSGFLRKASTLKFQKPLSRDSSSSSSSKLFADKSKLIALGPRKSLR